MKTLLWISLGLLILSLIYIILGKAGIVPMYYCSGAMTSSGVVEICGWYKGGPPIY